MSYDLMVFEKTKAPNTKKHFWHGIKNKQNGKKIMITRPSAFLLPPCKIGLWR